jgi:hypothetical protein
MVKYSKFLWSDRTGIGLITDYNSGLHSSEAHTIAISSLSYI